MKKVAVTGGIGSGKSVVCRAFAMLGIAVYDSDSRAKELMMHSPSVREAVCRAFGADIYHDEVLDRAALALRVFGDKEALLRLNSIVHPAVTHDFEEWAAEREHDGNTYAIMESAVLFENGLEKMFDYTVAVISPVEVRLARSMVRDGVSREKIEVRMANQMSQEQLAERADFVVRKDCGELVWPQILEIDRKIREDGVGR